MGRVLNPDQLNEWSDTTANEQYTKDLLFSSLFGIMSQKAALGSVHGTKVVENEVSGYYLADEISATYRGMLIAISQDK